MQVKIICKGCGSSILERKERGIKPTASMYAKIARAFNWKETDTGYLCNYCQKKQEEKQHD